MSARIIVAALLTFATSPAVACSIIGYRVFTPDPSGFEPKYDEENESRVLLPAPAPKILSVQRGTTSPGNECSDFGMLEVELAWPADSFYTLDEVGFYFRVVGGGPGDDPIFPDRPVVGTLERNRVMFSWLDGHPSTQGLLDVRVEVFAVNEGLQLGPSAFFDLKVLPGEHRGPLLIPIG